MNQSIIIPGADQQLASVELLREDELIAISGGLTPFMAGAAIVGGVLGVAIGGVVVGVAFYYFTRDEK